MAFIFHLSFFFLCAYGCGYSLIGDSAFVINFLYKYASGDGEEHMLLGRKDARIDAAFDNCFTDSLM